MKTVNNATVILKIATMTLHNAVIVWNYKAQAMCNVWPLNHVTDDWVISIPVFRRHLYCLNSYSQYTNSRHRSSSF